jgi:hypothetical protein
MTDGADGWQMLRRVHRTGLVEAAIWGMGLVAMACMNPEGTHLISLCLLDALGVSFCPGCGLGHAVAYLARGAFVESIRAHPLGIPAVVVLLVHVGRLVSQAHFGRS